MDTSVAKHVIDVIRAEQDSRLARLVAEEPELANALWHVYDEPFINELCLMLLVAIRHQVERELVLLAARVTSDGRELDTDQYRQKVEQLSQPGNWKKLKSKLQLTSFAEWEAMETLRLLANAYKHAPSTTPSKDLLKHLGLDLGGEYASLPESPTFREGLAASLDLQCDSDFCDIADELLARAGRFLTDVQAQVKLSPIKKLRVVPIGRFLR